jgi:hypothetical protein
VYRAPVLSSVDRDFLVRYKFMFSRYRDDCYFFNACFLTFNLTFAATPAILPADQPVSATLTMVVLVLFNLTLQMRLWPWKVRDLNYVYSAVLLNLALILVVGLGAIDGAPPSGGAVETLITIASGCQVASILLCIAKHGYTIVSRKTDSVDLEMKGAKLANDWAHVVSTLSLLPVADHAASLRDWSTHDEKAFSGMLHFLEEQSADAAPEQTQSKRNSRRITTKVAASVTTQSTKCSGSTAASTTAAAKGPAGLLGEAAPTPVAAKAQEQASQKIPIEISI